MVTEFIPSDSHEAACPVCGVLIRTTSQRRRVQCPKCREIVTLAPPAEPQPRLPDPPRPPRSAVESERARIDALESRVAALEEALKNAIASERGARPGARAQGKLRWLPKVAGQSPGISPDRQEALVHNLGTLGGQAITIRFVSGDPDARARAEWFRKAFKRANWVVHGPQEIAPTATEAELSLAVAELPVEKEAAATYLALKAAGFEVTPILDPDLPGGADDRAAPFSLIFAPPKAA
jgi:hypothetical protein